MHYVQKDNGMYVLSRNDIEQIATEKLKEYNPSLLERPRPLDTTDFLENYLGLVIKNKYICNFQSGILGLTVMGDIVPIPSYDDMLRPVVLEETFGTVLISLQLLGRQNRARRRYTEMHEASHFMLHQPYFRKCERTTAAGTEPSCSFIACRRVEIYKEDIRTDTDWLEYQADALAAAILMPQNTFLSYAHNVFRKNGVCGHCINVGKHDDTGKMCGMIYDIAETFFVSYQAAKIRMIHLGLIREY